MDLMKSNQQEMFKQNKREMKKYTLQDIENKKTKINAWVTRNKGIDLNEYRENISLMHYDFVAGVNAFLQTRVILSYLRMTKLDNNVLNDYFDYMNNMDINIQELMKLIRQVKKSVASQYARRKIEKLVKPFYEDMLNIIHFVVDDSKITDKRDVFNEEDED